MFTAKFVPDFADHAHIDLIMLQSSSEKPPLRPDLSFVEFVGLIALMMAMTAFAVDIMLPGLAQIGDELGLAEANDRQFIITFYLVGFAVGQLFFGPLSDRFGRKKPLYAGLVIFSLGAVMAAFASSAAMMFAARALQGIGAAAPRVIAIAIVRDRFSGRQMSRVMSFVIMTFIVIPILAPTAGQGIMALASWRWLFLVLLGAALATIVWSWLRLSETKAAGDSLPLSVSRIADAVRVVATTRQTAGYAIGFGFLFGVLMSYVGSAEQIFVDVYGLGKNFPMVFGAVASAMILASFINSRLVVRIGMRRVSHFALLAFLAVCGAMALFGYPEKPPLIVFCLFMAAAFFLFRAHRTEFQRDGHGAGRPYCGDRFLVHRLLYDGGGSDIRLADRAILRRHGAAFDHRLHLAGAGGAGIGAHHRARQAGEAAARAATATALTGSRAPRTISLRRSISGPTATKVWGRRRVSWQGGCRNRALRCPGRFHRHTWRSALPADARDRWPANSRAWSCRCFLN